MAKIAPFEEHTEQYEAWFERNVFVYKSELLAVRKALPANGTGIEIGVGSGKFAFPLGIRFGIEPSAKMRSLAVQKGIHVFEGTAENMLLEDNSFDFTLAVTTICFLDDVTKACSEIFRILRSHGSVIMGFVDKNSELGKKYQEHKNDNVFYRDAVFYSTDEVVSVLQKAGFSGFSFYQTIFRPLHEIIEAEPVLEGYGRGSFVVIRGNK